MSKHVSNLYVVHTGLSTQKSYIIRQFIVTIIFSVTDTLGSINLPLFEHWCIISSSFKSRTSYGSLLIISLDHGPRFPCMPFGQAAQLHESEPYNLDGWGPEAVKSGDPGLLSLMSITFDTSSRTTCGVHIPRAEHKGSLQRKAL